MNEPLSCMHVCLTVFTLAESVNIYDRACRENSRRFLAVSCGRRKAPLLIFDGVLNTP